MTSPRSIAAPLVVAGLMVAGCTGTQSAASPPDEPLPTIGLATEFELEPGLVSGSAEVRAIGADDVDTIVMIGDSITVASTPALEARFATLGFDEPVIVAQERKRMAEEIRDNPSGSAIAEFLTADDAPGDDRANELWIVALGTNDIGQYRADELAAAVNEVLAGVPEDAPLVWVDTYFRDESDDAARVNGIITDRVGRRGNAVVAPWSFYAASDGVMRSDGVHPSTSGTDVFAAVVAETAAVFLGR